MRYNNFHEQYVFLDIFRIKDDRLVCRGVADFDNLNKRVEKDINRDIRISEFIENRSPHKM
jgi:hypothetical protein